MNWLKNLDPLAIALVIVGVLIVGSLVVVGGLYGYASSLQSERVTRENQLSAQYSANQNYLSTYISTFYEELGVANLKSEKMDQILSDAVKGRYEDGGFSAGSPFFAAVSEAYPDISGLNIYDRIVDHIKSGREGYRAIQDKLLDMIRSYNDWRQDGYLQSRIIEDFIHVPSERLEARIGTNVYRGKEALEKMQQIITTSSTQKAYETGTRDPLAVPKE